MPEEEVDLAEERGRPLVEAEVQVQLKRAAVLNLQEQQKRTTALEEDDQPSEGEEMVGAEELSSAIGAKSGGTNRMNVLKVNQQVGEEHTLLNLKKQRHNHRKWRMHQKLVRPWC